jgi:3-oxoacyl-[acyl-carrier protein] reductase
VALVTGASEGIGLAIARRLVSDGYRVGMLARPSTKLDRAVADAGAAAFAVACDLGRPAEIDRAVDEVVAAGGRLDVLVNCASATRAGSVFSLTDDDWVAGFEVKFFGALRLTRQAWPHLSRPGAEAGGTGNVISIGGIGARTPRDAYAMTGPLSAALTALTKVLADRGRTDGVRVNAINPGAVLTPRLTATLTARAQSRGITLEEEIAEMVADHEVTRLGRPEDVAGVVSFLLSPEAQWLHGAVLDVDGGRTKAL